MGYEQPTSPKPTSRDIQNATHIYAVDAEASDAYAISLNPTLSAYADGQTFEFKANTANTGASSLNVDGLGAITLKKLTDQDTETGDIEAGTILVVSYDADNTTFQILSTTAAGSGISNIVEDTTPQLGGLLDSNSFGINESKGANIASATTTDIGTITDGNFVDITGTTTITGLGTIGAGVARTVRFNGILTLTHNGTSLILPSGANITTASGDMALFRSLGSGNWICENYTKADGTPIVGSGIASIVEDTTPQLGGSLDTNSKAINESKGTDVASANALNLGADGNSFDITGTTAITSINTEGVGTKVVLHFDGALTLTHHATDLILPTGSNITTAAGDIATFYEYATGDWRCISYTLADGTALSGLVNVVEDTSPQLGGALDTNGKAINQSKGADVASATALNLGADGNYFDITGTTTITSITTEGAGTEVTLHFDGILILTHHATDLILPSGASITTAAGDEATFIEYATGDWRCTNYSRADGTALVSAGGGGAWTLVDSGSFSQSISAFATTQLFSVTSLNGDTDGMYKIKIIGTSGGGAQSNLIMRFNSSAATVYNIGNIAWGDAVFQANSTDGYLIGRAAKLQSMDTFEMDVEIKASKLVGDNRRVARSVGFFLGQKQQESVVEWTDTTTEITSVQVLGYIETTQTFAGNYYFYKLTDY